jgi:hypothetical protein
MVAYLLASGCAGMEDMNPNGSIASIEALVLAAIFVTASLVILFIVRHNSRVKHDTGASGDSGNAWDGNSGDCGGDGGGD